MRTPWSRKPATRWGVLLAALLTYLSLTGCSDGRLFTETIKWKGGTFYNEGKGLIQEPLGPMTLTLRTDGTGYAVGVPRGYQEEPGNVCIKLTSEDRYDGPVTWRKVDDYLFEISFENSRYKLTDGPGKFLADWTEVRIYTCNWGYEFWSMQIGCAQSGLVLRDTPPCRD
ncbi:hypothetical protein SAMN04515692_101442 [Leifsonia sp. CL147]|nr:hypothetical protein SAMN04515694_10137 [Leifsonia sp. CL154]SFL23801.1 hypothetical protein SAMN04515692_101442 [Leifsonia sp. CL147]